VEIKLGNHEHNIGMSPEVEVNKKRNGFVVYVKERDRILGEYVVDVRHGLAVCHMRSEESGRGIPRVMINRAAQELQWLSDQTHSEITHEVHLDSKRAQKVLPHLYHELGYAVISNL